MSDRPGGGKVKISDAQLIEMREVRAKSLADCKPIDFRTLGERYRIHYKTAYRYCTGKIRPNCGGPIEQVDENPPGVVRLVRCECCGCRVPDREPCRFCQDQWEQGLLRALLTARVLSHPPTDEKTTSAYEAGRVANFHQHHRQTENQ